MNVGNDYEELGSGLFVMQTLLNHSCNDNVEIIAAGTLRAKIEIEANRDILPFPLLLFTVLPPLSLFFLSHADIKAGEELCSAYNKNVESNKDDFSANMYDSKEDHQNKLKRTWGITCNCIEGKRRVEIRRGKEEK